MFGDVPNLPVLVKRTHALAAGNPQNLMRLAQYLLECGVVRYSSGSWILPDRIDDSALPATMAQTFAALGQSEQVREIRTLLENLENLRGSANNGL